MTEKNTTATILFFSNYASLARGGQRSLSYILRDIDRSKYRPVLLCQEEGELTVLAAKLGVPVEVLRLPRLRPQHLRGVFRSLLLLQRIFKKHEVRIFHSEELVAIVLAWLLKPFSRARLLWHVRVRWDTPVQKFLSILFADRIICVSQAVAATFPRSPIVSVAPNGIDAAEYAPGSYITLSNKLSDDELLVGFAAALSPHKGPEVFIRSIPFVTAIHPQVRFLLAGAGDEGYVAQLKSLATALGIDKKIVFWGEEHANMAALMDRVTIFVLPSFTEGLSRSLLEAMALGKAVVASDLPENRELVTHGRTGLLAPAGDPEKFAGQISFLLSYPEQAAGMGANARRHVAEHFTLQKTMNAIYDVYGALLSGNGK